MGYRIPLHLPPDDLRTDDHNLVAATHWKIMRVLSGGRGFRPFPLPPTLRQKERAERRRKARYSMIVNIAAERLAQYIVVTDEMLARMGKLMSKATLEVMAFQGLWTYDVNTFMWERNTPAPAGQPWLRTYDGALT